MPFAILAVGSVIDELVNSSFCRALRYNAHYYFVISVTLEYLILGEKIDKGGKIKRVSEELEIILNKINLSHYLSFTRFRWIVSESSIRTILGPFR